MQAADGDFHQPLITRTTARYKEMTAEQRSDTFSKCQSKPCNTPPVDVFCHWDIETKEAKEYTPPCKRFHANVSEQGFFDHFQPLTEYISIMDFTMLLLETVLIWSDYLPEGNINDQTNTDKGSEMSTYQGNTDFPEQHKKAAKLEYLDTASDEYQLALGPYFRNNNTKKDPKDFDWLYKEKRKFEEEVKSFTHDAPNSRNRQQLGCRYNNSVIFVALSILLLTLTTLSMVPVFQIGYCATGKHIQLVGTSWKEDTDMATIHTFSAATKINPCLPYPWANLQGEKAITVSVEVPPVWTGQTETLVFKTKVIIPKHPTDSIDAEDEFDPLCKVCFDHQMNVVFLPCCHFATCESCANRVKNCVICREEIQGSFTVLME